MRRTPKKTGTQLIFPVLRIGDFFCVFLRYQIVINCVFSYINWVITQIRSLIKVLSGHPRQNAIRGMAGKFVDTISIFNRKRNSVKMNISGFAKIFHEQIDEIL